MTDPMGIVTVLAMAAVVYGTRISGLLLAPLINRFTGVRDLLEILPGCALIAVLAPAVARGTPGEILAVLVTALVYWVTGKTLVSLALGLALVLASAHLIGG